jgi:hypothetical protein
MPIPKGAKVTRMADDATTKAIVRDMQGAPAAYPRGGGGSRVWAIGDGKSVSDVWGGSGLGDWKTGETIDSRNPFVKGVK